MSLTIAVIGYLILAGVSISDKFILNKTLRPVTFVFYSCVFVLPVLFLIPFGVEFPRQNLDWFTAIISGVSFALALWTMYVSVQKSEVSHIGPLIGSSTALFTFILGRYFLSEQMTAVNLAGIFILIFGSALISFEKSDTHNGWHMGMFWGVISGLLFAVSHVASKLLYDVYGFYSGLVWTRGFLAVFGLLLLLSPLVRKEIFSRKKANKPKQTNNFFLVMGNKLFAVVAVVMIQYAIAIGSVTVVNALAGVQYGVLVVAVALLSKFSPRFCQEDYNRKEMILEGVAVLLIAVGLALIL